VSLFKRQPEKSKSDVPPEPSAVQAEPTPDAHKASTPTWFLEHLDEESRLSLQRARYDEYYEAEGWAGEGGGDISKMKPGYIAQVKPFYLAKKHLRDLIGHQKDSEDWSETGDLWDKYNEIIEKAERMGTVKGAEYLDLVCSRLIEKSGLGIKVKYQAGKDMLNPPRKKGDNGG